jgi:GxxExxY protein
MKKELSILGGNSQCREKVAHTNPEMFIMLIHGCGMVRLIFGSGRRLAASNGRMTFSLRTTSAVIARRPAIPVVYEAVRIHAGFFADLVVEDQVIVEIKAVETGAPVHKKQLLTYLKLADKRLGLLINFNVVRLKDGITRIVNGLKE